MWHGNWLKLSEEFANVIDCGKHQHNGVVTDLRNSLWTFLTGVDKWYLRIRGLDPFLFGEAYSSSLLTKWAKEGNLLPVQGIIQDGVADKHTKQAVVLVDTVIYHATLALHMLTVAASTCDVLRERFLQYQKICGELNQCFVLEDAMKCVARDELYHIVQKHASEGLLDKKMSAAAFLISYKLFDNMLETGDTNMMIKEFQDEWNVDAKKWKELGNEEYKDGQYLRAVANYTMAVKTNRYSAVLYGNRAQAYLKLGKFDEAELDGRRAVVLKPRWSKGYCRLAQAVEGQNRLHEAHCIASYGIKSCDEESASKDMLRIVEEKVGKKCKSEGHCNKKNKKGGHNEKKKNTSNVANGVNETADLNVENHWPSDVPELTDSDSDCSNDIVCDSLEEYNNISIEKLKNLLGLGSENLIAGRYQSAVECYERTLGEISSSSDMYAKLEIEPLCLTYALGVSYVSSGFSEDIQKAIALFTKNLRDSDVEKFPAIYYGLGQAYVKINRFKEAEEPLTKCLQILKTKSSFDIYMWPRNNHIIQETQKEKLQLVVEELLEKCSNPPESDAVCRYEMCRLDKKIYYNDPDFKGICVVCCHDQCCVEYHPACWKQLKELLVRTDKEFLGQNCLTPDCNSTIVLVKLEDKYQTIVKQFEDDNAQKNKSTQKHRKNRLEKKFEQKERRKRKRQESLSSTKQSSEHTERSSSYSEQEAVESCEANIQESSSVERKEEKTDNLQSTVCEANKNKEPANMHLTYTATSVPVCVLKKNEGDLAPKDQKVKKPKERKKQKSKTVMSIEEFCDGAEDFSVFNEYQQRIKRLLEENKRMIEEGDNSWVDFCEKHENIPQLDPSRPFYVDKSIRDNPVALDAILQLCGGVGETEEMRTMRESVYTYMEEFLQCKGPIHKDDAILLNEVSKFSSETQELILQSGGLEKFLLTSMNFAVANDYICLLSDVLTVYSLPYEKPASRYCDSLDTFDDFQQYDRDKNFSEETNTSVDPTKSTLNPHASEYSPLQKITDNENCSSMEHINEKLNGTDILNDATGSDYCNESFHINNNYNNEDKSEIEQSDYLIQNEHATNEKERTSPSNISFNANENISNESDDEDIIGKHSPKEDSNSSDSYKSGKEYFIPYEEMSYQQLTEVIVSMLNKLSEYKMCQELTADILNKKLNCFQITLLGAKGKATFPSVLDYAELQKNISCLEDEKEELEQKVNENLDTITQLKKKHSLEIATLQCSLAESAATKQTLQKEIDELMQLRDTKNRQWQQERTKLQEENKALQDNLTTLSQKLATLQIERDRMNLHIEKLKNEMQAEIEEKNELQKSVDSLYKKCEKQRTENMILSEQVRKGCLPPNMPPPTPPSFPCYYPHPPPNFLPPPNPPPPKSHLDVLFPPRPNHGRGGTFTGPPPGLESPLQILPEYTSRNDKDLKHPCIPPIPLPPSAAKTCGESTGPFTVVSASSSPPTRIGESTSSFIKQYEPTPAPLKNADSVGSLSFNSSEVPFSRPPSGNAEITSTDTKSDTAAHTSHFVTVTTSNSESYNKPTPITIVNWNSSMRNGTDSKKPFGIRMPPKLQTDSQKNNSFEKLMSRLESQFPNISRKDLASSLKEYRAQNNNTLSGMTIDAIINGVSIIIRKNKKLAPTNDKLHVPSQSSQAAENREVLPAWTKRMAKMKPWCKSSADCDNNCSICLEDMTRYVSFEVECGHSFHYKCIHGWLAKQSTCPICRIHVLLPDEFPALGQ